MGESLGLVAGAGALPSLVAGAARRAGWRVVAFALEDPGTLAGVADAVWPSRATEVAAIIEALGREGIRHVVLAGRVSKQPLLQGAPLDDSAAALVARSADWTDDALLRVAAEALAGLGIELVDPRRFLEPWLAPAGLVAGPEPAAEVWADMRRGLLVARDLARHGVGQTVILRHGVVVAVEGAEGTDEAIRRGLALAGRGGVVVKAPAPGHDYRFDVPAVGLETVALIAAGGAAALAVEAGRVLLLDRERIATEASRSGISVAGIPADHARS